MTFIQTFLVLLLFIDALLRKKERDKLIQLFLHNNEIQRCGYGLQEESIKLLGVKIDENLDWKEVSKKISKGN